MATDAEKPPHEHAQPWIVLRAITVVGICLSLFQLWAAGLQPLGLFFQRPIHLGFILVLCFLIYPVWGQQRPRGLSGWIIDGTLLVASVVAGAWLPVNIDTIANQIFPRDIDVWIGVLTVLLVLEGARRAVGLGMTIIGVVFIAYAFAGNRGELPFLADLMPGILNHRGYSLDRLASQMTLGAEGIFGIPLGVAATFVFIFVLFGAFLEATGAGKFFIDLAYAATGRQRGGPAKAAVIASAGMGSISGSAIANVVTTGAFTIPLMKRLGYRPAQAGGIEAAASTGGQIMPPLMGAGAFLMSEFTQVPYVDIVLVSIFPAVLYFGVVYLLVHIAAVKQGLTGMTSSELPSVRGVLAEGWHFLLPLVALVALLVAGYSPMRVGFYAIVSILAAAAARALWVFSRDAPTSEKFVALCQRGLVLVAQALALGARNAVAVSMACAVAGIIVGVVGLTGLGLKFSAMMIAFSGGNIVLALILVISREPYPRHGPSGDGSLYRFDHSCRPCADGGIRHPDPDRASCGVLVFARQQRDASGRARRLRRSCHSRFKASGNQRPGMEVCERSLPHSAFHGLQRTHHPRGAFAARAVERVHRHRGPGRLRRRSGRFPLALDADLATRAYRAGRHRDLLAEHRRRGGWGRPDLAPVGAQQGTVRRHAIKNLRLRTAGSSKVPPRPREAAWLCPTGNHHSPRVRLVP
jgi:TRAP transporter 4TM/12TM fusion protein